MIPQYKRIIAGLGLLALLYGVSDVFAEPARKNSPREKFVSIALPAKERLTLVSYVPLIVEGKIIGGLAAYDDAATERSADYVELYDNVGTLLAIGWFDRYGIERLAVDRAFVDDTGRFEGNFVLIVTGNVV